MNNYYALIYLTEHLKFKFTNARYLFSFSPHKNVWEGFFQVQNDKQYRLVFSTTPGEIALFTNTYSPPKKHNVLYFFDSLKEQVVENISLAEGDRLLTMNFNDGSHLLFQLFGNNANLYLVKDGIIFDAFKNTGKVTGKPPPQPRIPVKKTGIPDFKTPEQGLFYFDKKLPRHLSKPIIKHYGLDNASPEQIKKTVEKLVNAMKNEPSFRVTKDGNICLIPEKYLPVEDKKVFDNINEAIRFTYYKASHLRRFSNKLKSIKPAIESELKKARRTLQQLEDADKALERAETYEQFGHLLMAHAHEKLGPDQQNLELKNFYEEDKLQKIPVKPDLNIAENAQRYYEKSTKARRRVTESKRRKKETEQKIQQLEKLLHSLDTVDRLHELEGWEKKHSDLLDKLGLFSQKKQASPLPFRQTTIDGYDVWIGKNAKSNDELTTKAHKEDIWLHARGASGSHVVIRMNNNDNYPPRKIILRAAAYAAWNSKLRGAELVPVIVTKRKYVTKPKGAPAGTVRVQKENVELVPPKKP